MKKNKIFQLIVSILIFLIPFFYSGTIFSQPFGVNWSLELKYILFASKIVCSIISLYLIYKVFDE